MVFQNVKAELCYLDYIFQKTSLCLVSITFYFLTFFLSWHRQGGSANFCHFQSLFFLFFTFSLLHFSLLYIQFLFYDHISFDRVLFVNAGSHHGLLEQRSCEQVKVSEGVVTVEEVAGSSRRAGRLWELWVCLEYE